MKARLCATCNTCIKHKRSDAVYCSVKCCDVVNIARRKAKGVNYNEYNRNYALLYNYGISQADYDALLSKQNYVCAICGNKETSKYKYLSVDHCHYTKKVRGLLCSHCNKGLGLFKDNTQTLQNAITYLEKGIK